MRAGARNLIIGSSLLLGHPLGASQSLHVPENYAAFSLFHALTTPPGGDEDRDGLDNTMDYALGLHPLRPDAGGIGLPRLLNAAGNDLFFFDMPELPPADLELEIQSGTGMVTWSLLATRTGSAPWTGTLPPPLSPSANGRQTVTLTRPESNSRRFYRLIARLRP